LATDRDDLEIGAATMGRDKSDNTIISYNFRNPKKYGNNASLIVKPFINGFDVSSK